MKKSQLKNVDNFQRNARSCHLVFQNEANFGPREAYPQFGEPRSCSISLLNASGGYN